MIEGDLTVNGNVTSVNTTNYSVNDRLIKLGDGNQGSSHDLGIIFTRGDGSTSNVGNKLFIWDESDDTFAMVNADVTGDSIDPSVDFAGNYAPLRTGNLIAESTSVNDISISGNLTLGGKVISGLELDTVNDITLGQSQNGKALTQSSTGIVKIGSNEGTQVLELLSHSAQHSALKLGSVSVNATGNESNDKWYSK